MTLAFFALRFSGRCAYVMVNTELRSFEILEKLNTMHGKLITGTSNQ